MSENEKLVADNLEFWQGHRNKIAQIYNNFPTENNLQWIKDVDARIEKMFNSDPHQKIVVKPNFGDVVQGKGKAKKK